MFGHPTNLFNYQTLVHHRTHETSKSTQEGETENDSKTKGSI